MHEASVYLFTYESTGGKLLRQTHVKYSTMTKQKLEGQTKGERQAPFQIKKLYVLMLKFKLKICPATYTARINVSDIWRFITSIYLIGENNVI